LRLSRHGDEPLGKDPRRGGEAGRRSRASCLCSSPKSICRSVGDTIVDVFFFFLEASFFFFPSLLAPRPPSPVFYSE